MSEKCKGDFSDRVCVVFTLCSNNYLAHAKVLCNSINRCNPEIKLVIGLVDKKSKEIDYSLFYPAEVVEIDEHVVPGFSDMSSRYNIVELNTAVKPFVFEYLIGSNPECHSIYYFDPDIRVYASLNIISEQFQHGDILLTPHFYTPIELDGHFPSEPIALNYGIYNLGFLGLNTKSIEVRKFLRWWKERTFQHGYAKPQEGLFVDQLWINLVPLFFDRVHIVRHYGCNMAPWNLHERDIQVFTNESTRLTNGDLLIFYHFSSYSFKKPELLSKYYDRYNFRDRPVLQCLYQAYHQELLLNKVEEYATIKCALPVIVYTPKLKHILVRPLYNLLIKLWYKI